MKRTAAALVVAALPLTARAVPLRVQAEIGGFIPGSESAYGTSGASFLRDYGAIDHPPIETDPAFGLTFSILPTEFLELGLSARRYVASDTYALKDLPEIGQRQDTTLYPLLALIGLRGGTDVAKFTLGGGGGVAFTRVDRRGYLDDGAAESAGVCLRVYGGVAVMLPLGLDLGVQLARDFTELPSTNPILPIEGERAGGGLGLAVTLGWQSPAD